MKDRSKYESLCKKTRGSKNHRRSLIASIRRYALGHKKHLASTTTDDNKGHNHQRFLRAIHVSSMNRALQRTLENHTDMRAIFNSDDLNLWRKEIEPMKEEASRMTTATIKNIESITSDIFTHTNFRESCFLQMELANPLNRVHCHQQKHMKFSFETNVAKMDFTSVEFPV